MSKTSSGGLRAESEPVSACEEQAEQGETRLTRATKERLYINLFYASNQKSERVS
jgi:hypothetical protein